MRQTADFQLNQWDLTDRIQMEDFNSDNAKVDAALSAISDRVDLKAAQSDLTALTSRVNAKAEQSALNTLSSRVDAKAEQSALNTLSGRVDTKAAQSDLTALSSRVDSLCSYIWLGETVSQDASYRIDLTLPAIDWNAWQQVVLDLEIPTCDFYIRGYLNGASTHAYLSSGGNQDYNAAFSLRVGETMARLTLEPGRKSWRAVSARIVTANERFICAYPGLAYGSLQYVTLNSHDTNYVIPAGCKVTVWGIR